MTPRPKRSYGDVRRLSDVGKNLSLTLPKEISDMLRRAGVDTVRVTTTSEGILIVPWREPEIPAWAQPTAEERKMTEPNIDGGGE